VIVENARDLTKKTNLPLSIGHYLNNMALLTNQWTSKNYKDPDRQRIYLKDIDCPALWHDKLSNIIPPALFYLNESTGELGGPGAVEEPNPHGPGVRRGRAIAHAGDLMSSLPPEMRAENMMCYIGHEGTYTPAHREMCASMGHNIMVETSTGAVEDGKPTKPGSSIWFMTETKDRHVVSEYWLSALGHDIEVENHFAQINAWKAAPFKTWVVEQRVGDFILIPPLAPHQVWNRGTRTMKAAWNRTTVETLEMALEEALPRARMVCRDEQYKNKAIVYYTLFKYSKLLNAAVGLVQRGSNKPPAKVRQLGKDFRRLHTLYTQILISESFAPGQEEKKVELIPYDSNITCSYCRCNIFNRFLTCPSCIGELPNGDEDTYDICMECYAMGRSCLCISKLKWIEQFSWADLTQKHEQWRRQIVRYEFPGTEKSPKVLKVELEWYGKRSLAEICQIELKKRSWKDIRKPAAPADDGNESEEVVVNGEGMVQKKKRRPRQSEKFKREHKLCHFHTTWEPKWKQIECSQCQASFCYGTLARAFDMKPQEILAERAWKCPKCRNFCICRKCRSKPGWKMIEPPRIMLGHDTKKVADPRSVENLVDYSQSNISWLQKVGDDGTKDTRRLQKRKLAAEKAKSQAPQLGDDYVQDTNMAGQGHDAVEDSLLRLARHEGIPIDPNLSNGGGDVLQSGESQDEDERYNENPEEASIGDIYESPSHQDPPQPQHVIPAGGIIRDAERAYDPTEAITFDYPDPEFEHQAPQSAEQAPPKVQAPPGYEAAVLPEEPAEIEMVQRKRKRSGAEPGDEPYRNHRKVFKDRGRRKTKERKSLVVRLNVDKGKLAELNKMAIIAQRALNGVADDDTPVISSDLRALNAESGAANAQPPAKKIRVEREDEDDDFAGPRVRKDKPLSGPDMHMLPARRTRMHHVAYDEPSDGEGFEEFIGDASGGKSRSRPQMEPNKNEAQSPSKSSSRTDKEETAASSPGDPNITTLPEEKAGAVSAIDTLPAAQEVTLDRTYGITSFAEFDKDNTPRRESFKSIRTAENAIDVRSQSPDGQVIAAKPSSSSVKDGLTPSSMAASSLGRKQKVKPPQRPSMSEVEKNRKAKLAAMHWADGDSDDFEAEMSSGSDAEGDEDEDDFEEDVSVSKVRTPKIAAVAVKSRKSLPASLQAASKPLLSAGAKSASARKAGPGQWSHVVISSDEEMADADSDHTGRSSSSAGVKRDVSGSRSMLSRRGRPQRGGLRL
jgi:JmjC domain, hydroxylase/Zinc-finger domain of monoamine-oxidase A repressor R1